MFHRVKSVTALPNYILYIIFENDIIKYYDVKPLFDKWLEFNTLRKINNLFNEVKVDLGGYGISWNDEIDLSCNELWNNGQINKIT